MSLVLENNQEFKHILRIFNTNIDGKRKVAYGLRVIKGIGRRFAHLICKIGRVNPNMRAGQLSEQECQTLQNIVQDPLGNGIPKWFLNRQRDFKDGNTFQMISNHYDTKMREDMERIKKIRCHKGLRHFWGLKVRGQHTKSTGRRGAVMGVTKKK